MARFLSNKELVQQYYVAMNGRVDSKENARLKRLQKRKNQNTPRFKAKNGAESNHTIYTRVPVLTFDGLCDSGRPVYFNSIVDFPIVDQDKFCFAGFVLNNTVAPVGTPSQAATVATAGMFFCINTSDKKICAGEPVGMLFKDMSDAAEKLNRLQPEQDRYAADLYRGNYPVVCPLSDVYDEYMKKELDSGFLLASFSAFAQKWNDFLNGHGNRDPTWKDINSDHLWSASLDKIRQSLDLNAMRFVQRRYVGKAAETAEPGKGFHIVI